MALETVCPICGLSPMPSGKTQCPQCDADLTCFKVLDSLPDELVRKNTGSRQQVILLVAVSLVLGLISVMSFYQFYWFKQFETRIVSGLKRFKTDQSRPHTNGTPKTRAAIETKNEIEGQSVSIKPPKTADIGDCLVEDGEFWVYWATEKDTLWDISKKHYGAGDYYPVLLEHNCHLGIYDIGDGIQIKILKNTAKAQDIYKKITAKKGNSIYWYYTVAEGDTLGSVTGKFYKTKNMIKLITDNNPDIDLRPGERIRILLK